ncbi:MAG: dethiobiotin synthase [Crocinitomicaceae bacterium]
MSQRFAVTGIGTDVGKTVVSAILAESLQANYWKPVQAGDLDNSDSTKVERYTSNVNLLPEKFKLTEPMSPHAAARIDGVQIAKEDLNLPAVSGNLIVEGAGGLLVPFNDDGLLFADLLEYWGLPTIVVSRHYLGSINHTLLTMETLKKRGVEVAGIIFVGNENNETEQVIKSVTGVKVLGRIPIAKELNDKFIQEQAKQFQW